jgi:hypothetical protein
MERCSGYPLKYQPGNAVGVWAICPTSTGYDRQLWVDSVEKVGHGLRIKKVRVRD